MLGKKVFRLLSSIFCIITNLICPTSSSSHEISYMQKAQTGYSVNFLDSFTAFVEGQGACQAGLVFFGTLHRVPPQSSPGIIEKAFSFVSLSKPTQSPYNLELLTVQECRDQVEDYNSFVSTVTQMG
jgi:hypothetical protein